MTEYRNNNSDRMSDNHEKCSDSNTNKKSTHNVGSSYNKEREKNAESGKKSHDRTTYGSSKKSE